MIDKSREELEKRSGSIRNMSEENRRESSMIYGTPEEVKHQVEAFRDAGIEYLIAYFEPKVEFEALGLFAREVARSF